MMMDRWKRAMNLSGRVKIEVAGGDCRDGKRWQSWWMIETYRGYVLIYISFS
jgi:hypothetical protein